MRKRNEKETTRGKGNEKKGKHVSFDANSPPPPKKSGALLLRGQFLFLGPYVLVILNGEKREMEEKGLTTIDLRPGSISMFTDEAMKGTDACDKNENKERRRKKNTELV